ncbi:hypothetical protein ACQZ5N_03070 [Agrobacterium sp. 22-221-1]
MIFYTLDLNGAISYGQGYLLPDGAEEIAEDEYHAALAAARSALLEPPIPDEGGVIPK